MRAHARYLYQVAQGELQECEVFRCLSKKVRPLCKACVYGEDRQTSTDRYRIHWPLPTIEGQRFVVDAFACGHSSWFQVVRRDERWRKPDDLLQLYKESGSRGDSHSYRVLFFDCLTQHAMHVLIDYRQHERESDNRVRIKFIIVILGYDSV